MLFLYYKNFKTNLLDFTRNLNFVFRRYDHITSLKRKEKNFNPKYLSCDNEWEYC